MQGVILAGGRSSRLGTEKPLLQVGERSIIEGLLAAMSSVVETVRVVTNRPELYRFLGVELLGDLQVGRGPLAGIEAGLVRGGRGLFVAADYPFLTEGLLAELVRVAEGAAAAAPFWAGHWEPLVGVYDPLLLDSIRAELAGAGRAAAVLTGARAVGPEVFARFGPPERLFFNVNTPADLELARSLIRERPLPSAGANAKMEQGFSQGGGRHEFSRTPAAAAPEDRGDPEPDPRDGAGG